MPIIPYTSDLWGDWDPWRNRVFDHNFGMGVTSGDLMPRLMPTPTLPRSFYRRPWAMAESILNRDQERLMNEQQINTMTCTGPDGFQVCIDVQQFAPNEITVKMVNDNTVLVEGKHEERQDEHGYITRQFVRRYVLPPSVNVLSVESCLSSDGVLTIKAPPAVTGALESNERTIQIKHTGPVHLSMTKKAKGTKEKTASDEMEATIT